MKKTKTEGRRHVPDVGDPKTWVKYRSNFCQKCTAGCCTMPVRVDTEDLFHMGLIEIDEVNGPLKKVAARLKRNKIIRTFFERTRTFMLYQHPNNDCIFLDENRLCKIYDSRPAVCRDFPKNSQRPGFCPAVRKKQTF